MTEYRDVTSARRTTTRGVQSIAPYAVVAMLVGLLLLVVAAIVLLRGDYTDGLDGSTVRVLGLDHTPLLGVVEAVAGVLLILGGASRSRALVMTVGLLLAAFGIVLLAEHDQLHDNLGATAAHGGWALGLGLVVFLLAMLTPSVQRTSTTAVTDVDDLRAGTVTVEDDLHDRRLR